MLKTILNFYINSSLHVALAVVSLCGISYFSFQVSPDWKLLVFVFLGSVLGYNFVKYAGIAKLYHRRRAKGLRLIQVMSLIFFILFVIFSFFIPYPVLLFTGFFGVFTLLYALPLFSRRRNLRSISGLKIFIIAWVWSGVTVVLPLVEEISFFSERFWMEFLQRFLLILVWILPFEIRDLKYDLEQLGTLPQRMGITDTKIFGTFLLLLVLFIEYFQSNHVDAIFISLTLIIILSLVLVWNAREKQSKYYSSFWVEALPIAWLLLLVLFRK